MEFITTAVLLIIGCVLLYKYLTNNSKQRASTLPGPKRLPCFGSALQLNPNNLHGQFTDFAKFYGNIFEIKIFDTTNIVLNTTELITKAFQSEEYKDVFHNRPVFTTPALAIGRRNITLRDLDEKHNHMRKYLIKGLNATGEGITPFEDIMGKEIRRVMNEIENKNGAEVELVALSKRSVSNVMSILLIGEMASDDDVTNYFDLIESLDFYMDPLTNLFVSKVPYLRFAPVFRQNFDRIKESYRKIMDKTFYRSKDTWTADEFRGVVDWYLQEQQRELTHHDEIVLTDDVIKGITFDFLTAGIVTTATMFPCVMLCLVNHPGYQRRVQGELDTVIGRDREPTVNDKNGCHLLQAVIYETLRLITPVPFLLPHVTSRDAEFQGHFVKKGTQIIANAWYVLHNEDIWKDPWVFRPERFLDDEGNLLPSTHEHMKNWIPFGVGRRKCPGVNLATTRIFLYVACLLQKWRFIPSPENLTSHDPRLGDFDFHFLLRLKKFCCIAKDRQ